MSCSHRHREQGLCFHPADLSVEIVTTEKRTSILRLCLVYKSVQVEARAVAPMYSKENCSKYVSYSIRVVSGPRLSVWGGGGGDKAS